MTAERVIAIPADHPSLSGHFPGHPVVPGVVLLSEVLETLQQVMPQPVMVTGLPAIKFMTPLQPGEALTICIEQEQPGHALFRCQAGRRLVAAGSVDFTARTTGEAMIG